MTRFNWRFAVVVTLVVLMSTVALQASPITTYTAYTDPVGQGTQAWGGNLALLFNVNTPINVTSLGVFNASGTAAINGTIQVGIFNISNPTPTLETSVIFTPGPYTPPGGAVYDVFQSTTPVHLGPGSYEIDAFGFSSADLNGNLNTGSLSGPLLTGNGALTYVGAAWDSNFASLDAPTTCPSCQGAPVPQSSQFDAGTFKYQVPEPSMLGLLCMGLIGVGGIRRKLAR